MKVSKDKLLAYSKSFGALLKALVIVALLILNVFPAFQCQLAEQRSSEVNCHLRVDGRTVPIFSSTKTVGLGYQLAATMCGLVKYGFNSLERDGDIVPFVTVGDIDQIRSLVVKSMTIPLTALLTWIPFKFVRALLALF